LNLLTNNTQQKERQPFFKYTNRNSKTFFNYSVLSKMPYLNYKKKQRPFDLPWTVAGVTGLNDSLLNYFYPDGFLVNDYYFYTGIEKSFIDADGMYLDFVKSEYGHWPVFLAEKLNISTTQACIEILSVSWEDFRNSTTLEIITYLENYMANVFPLLYFEEVK
jgi:hypothetical protein